jgi:hypothetical protein
MLGVRQARLAKATLYLILPLVALGCFVLRGVHRYDAPGYGGPELRFTQWGAEEILATGTTDQVYHPSGHYYWVALVYLLLPRQLNSVIVVQILLLPALVAAATRLAREIGGDRSALAALVLNACYPAYAFYAAYPHGAFVLILLMTMTALLSIPLIRDDRVAWWQPVLAGLFLGATTCFKPYYGTVGIVLAVAVLYGRRSWRDLLARVTPVALVSLLLFGAMTLANPPREGELIRGGQGMARSLLMGSYQYAYQWWDAEPFETSTTLPGAIEYQAHLERLQQQTGEDFEHPETQRLILEAGKQRYRDSPALLAKKALISIVSVWILVPSFAGSWILTAAFAVGELTLLALAIAGLVHTARTTRLWPFLLGLLLIPTLFHIPFHVEARYSSPMKPIELALAAVAITSLWSSWSSRSAPKASSASPM